MDEKPRISKGQSITARWLNALADLIWSCRVFSDGTILVNRTAGGTFIRTAGGISGGGASIPIFTQTGGIGARVTTTPGKATNVLRLRWVGDTLPTSGVTETVTVYNVSSIAINANRYGIATLVEGHWVAVVESCA